ncbi:MAG: polysaccharide biosynthesis/export family protein, partial [Planctomycetales bacterium]|nr:polysaccharide biosynthesis/export family protein [Planctomycetales bacterium]
FPGKPGADGSTAGAMRPPAELTKVSLPAYRIEIPDVLLIDAVRVVPKDPYMLQPLDVIQVVVLGTSQEMGPIAGPYAVESTGVVNLGPAYGSVKIEGLTTDEARDEIQRHLASPAGGQLLSPMVSVSLLQMSGLQQIAGEHLVSPDGTINMGVYGNVYVNGMTVQEARHAVEMHLSQFLDRPRISLDVFAYNSKFFYIITEGAGFGEQVARAPVTGNETVLDAVSQVGGLGRASSTKMWIARPAPHGVVGCDQVLPIDWQAITRGASTATNYQLLPGDRLFIAEDRMVAFDGMISKLLNPFERMFGFSLLGSQTIQSVNRLPAGIP